jgi:molybdenum cofactor cytidylyltransferase
VILAAGGSTRFTGPAGVHKLLAPWRGRPLCTWAVEAAVSAGIGPVWVVDGAVDLTSVVPPEVSVLHNPLWESGQAVSLQVAINAARRSDLDAVVVGLADQPLLPASAWRDVASSRAAIAVATYDGQRRNPVRLAAAVWDLLPTSGDEGARSVARRRPELVEEVPCEGDPTDIDTREDLARWS